MKIAKQIRIALLSLLIAGSGSVNAGGIPVIDISHITQTIAIYTQKLKDYKEYLVQSTLLDNQYLQMLTDYNQVMKEYAHYLNQIKGLQHIISESEWKELMASIEPYYGSFDPGLLPTMDTTSATYHSDTRAILESYDMAPKTTAETVDAYKALNAGVYGADKFKQLKKDSDRLNRSYERYANQMEVMAKNNERLEEFDNKKRKKAEEKLAELKDESDLATLQHIAFQQNLAMQQQKLIAEIQNQHLQTYESMSAFADSVEIRARKQEIERLQGIKGTRAAKGGVNNWSELGL